MKTSELIRKLAYEIQMYGDLEISVKITDRNLIEQEVRGALDVSHDFDKTCLLIWQQHE